MRIRHQAANCATLVTKAFDTADSSTNTMVLLKLTTLLLCLTELQGFAPNVNERPRQTNLQMFKKAARSTEEDIEKTLAVILKRMGTDDIGIICEKELTASIEAESVDAGSSTNEPELDELFLPYQAAARLAYDMKHDKFDETTFAAFEDQFRSKAIKEAFVSQHEPAEGKPRRRWRFWKK